MKALLFMLLVPFGALALGEGSWQDSGIGVTLSNRGVTASSRPLKPMQPVTGRMTLIAWTYVLDGPTPAGLTVKLCSPTNCTPLEGDNGTTRGLTNTDANQPLRFVWEVPGGGSMYPPLRVRSNQVIVNYIQ